MRRKYAAFSKSDHWRFAAFFTDVYVGHLACGRGRNGGAKQVPGGIDGAQEQLQGPFSFARNDSMYKESTAYVLCIDSV
jgi:hypothetical protein